MDIKQLNEELEKILNEDTNEIIFSSLDELEDYIRTKHSFPDDFIYNNAKYTMEEYDMEGKTLTYASCDNEQGIRVETPENRYNKNIDYSDMEIEIEEYEPFGLRDDIGYNSIDGNRYYIIDSGKEGLVWSKSSDSFIIDVYSKLDEYDRTGAMVDLGKTKKDNEYTIYIKHKGLYDTLPEKVKNQKEAIEVVKSYLINKLGIKNENNAVVEIKKYN